MGFLPDNVHVKYCLEITMEKHCFQVLYSKQGGTELDINLICCSTTVSKGHCIRFISYFQYIAQHEKTVQQEILNFV